MNNHIFKNILFYGSFGGFGIYTFYQVSKSEFNRKMKLSQYYDSMINKYLVLEKCNTSFNKKYNDFELLKTNINNSNHKESIIKLIQPNHITYHPECITFYNDFKKSYHTYHLYKYDIDYKYNI